MMNSFLRVIFNDVEDLFFHDMFALHDVNVHGYLDGRPGIVDQKIATLWLMRLFIRAHGLGK